jgi:hypothetical protein
MSWFGWLTGDSKTLNKTVDAAVSAGDKLFYTDEEKAESSQLYREWYLKYLQATQPQNIARRMIAIAITALWVYLVLLATIAEALSYQDFAAYVFKVLETVVNPPLMIIIGFYFLKHIVSSRDN